MCFPQLSGQETMGETGGSPEILRHGTGAEIDVLLFRRAAAAFLSGGVSPYGEG